MPVELATQLTTTIHFDLTDAHELPLTSGRLEWVPSRGQRQDARLIGGGRIVYPAPFEVRVGVLTPDITVTSTDDPRFTAHPWCWQVTERLPKGGRTRWVLVPHSDTPLAYSDLTEVDPSSFEPTASPPAAWVAALAQANALIAAQASALTALTSRVAGLEAGGATAPAGYTPGYLPNYLEPYL